MTGGYAANKEKIAWRFPDDSEKEPGKDQHPYLRVGCRIPPQWQLSLEALLDGLERIPAATEVRFLKVSAMLQEISAKLLAIGEGAEKAARMMSAEESLSVVASMEQLLDRLEDDFLAADHAAVRIGSLLGNMLDELGAMARLLESFKGHVGNLRMLKLLTNIQVASLRLTGVDFGNIATDIGALAQNIQAKSEAILRRVKALNAELLKGKAMVAELGETQQQLNKAMIGAVRTKIAILADMHSNCSTAARNISSRAAGISRSVGSIVVALQFQDITRQQMEHAREALVSVQNRIALEGIFTDEIAGICALQSAQLANSADELARAVTGIATSLETVASDALDSSAGVHRLFQQTDTAGRSSFDDIEQNLGQLSGAFTENMAARGNLADIARATVDAMGEITGFAGEIDFLGAEIRLIALNAIIKAVQTGREGAAFSVIAENIKAQSDEICRQAAAINTGIDNIGRHVVDLNQLMNLAGERSAAVRAEEIVATTDRLRCLVEGAAEALLDTDKAADQLAGIIAKTVAALSSRELIAVLQKDLQPRVQRLSAGLTQHAGWSADVQGEELRYTMGSERAVHEKFIGEAATNHWNGTPVLTAVPSATANDSHFDSNVELF